MALTTQYPQVLVQLEQQLSKVYTIDSADDVDFGKLYRLWKNLNLVGTFYQNLDGKWIAQPSSGQVNGKFDTKEQVILAIMRATENLGTNIDSLLSLAI